MVFTHLSRIRSTRNGNSSNLRFTFQTVTIALRLRAAGPYRKDNKPRGPLHPTRLLIFRRLPVRATVLVLRR